MAYSFSDDLKEEIRQRIDIVALISESVALRRSGTNHIGLCPFHKEKSPSFSVNPARRIFYCFGCNEGGDVFTFLMKKDGLPFPDAVEKLALAAGIDLERYRTDTGAASRLTRIYEANTLAAAYFRKSLEAHAPAREYLEKRGLSQAIVERFELGYAPEGWSSLIDHLRPMGFQPGELVEGGLAKIGERGSPYDMFRDRVMFPIHDDRGRIAGFGGRLLGDGKPKYVNSPETQVFSKGRLLFNLARVTAPGAEQRRDVVLVEGYMDVVGLAAGGFDHAVAGLGTALTDHQVRKLARIAKTLFLSYDADEAGVRATSRSLELLESTGLPVKVLRLPEGKDPDEYIARAGLDGWMAVMAAASEVEDYLFDAVCSRFDLSRLDEKRAAFRELKQVFALLPSPPGQERFMRRVADRFEMAESKVRETFSRRGAVPTDESLRPRSQRQADPLASKERYLVSCCLTDVGLFVRHQDALAAGLVEDPRALSVFDLMSTLSRTEGSVTELILADLIDPEVRAYVLESTVDFLMPDKDPDRAIRECLTLLRRGRLQKRKSELSAQLRSVVDPEEKSRVKTELTGLMTELDLLRREVAR